jgi:hypothetical protein
MMEDRFLIMFFVWNAMGTYVHQVITKLLYLLNQGETFTKVRIFVLMFLLRVHCLIFIQMRVILMDVVMMMLDEVSDVIFELSGSDEELS